MVNHEGDICMDPLDIGLLVETCLCTERQAVRALMICGCDLAEAIEWIEYNVVIPTPYAPGRESEFSGNTPSMDALYRQYMIEPSTRRTPMFIRGGRRF